MPNWKKLADTAKRTIDQRGGTDALKRDFEKVKEAATGPGTAKEKAQRAADAAKASEVATGKPGAAPSPANDAATPPPGDPAVAPKPDPNAPGASGI